MGISKDLWRAQLSAILILHLLNVFVSDVTSYNMNITIDVCTCQKSHNALIYVLCCSLFSIVPSDEMHCFNNVRATFCWVINEFATAVKVSQFRKLYVLHFGSVSFYNPSNVSFKSYKSLLILKFQSTYNISLSCKNV